MSTLGLNRRRPSGMIIFACGDCGERFVGSENLGTHQSRSNHGPYKSQSRVSWYVSCYDCNGRTFMDPLGLLSHQQAKLHGSYGAFSEEKKLQPRFRRKMCPVADCTISFKKVDMLFQHLKDTHPKINWSVAPPSQGSIPTVIGDTGATPPLDAPNTCAPNTIVQDTGINSNPIGGRRGRRGQTTEAGVSFNPTGHRQDQPTKETKEAKISRKPQPETYTCIVFHCSGVFSTPKGLHRHEVEVHKLPKERQVSQRYKIKCSIKGCSESHWSKTKHEKHMKNAHGEQYRCLDCERDFENANALEMHLNDKVHASRPTALELPPNTCPLCNKTFKTASGLRSHSTSRKHNPITKGLACIRPGCKKKFNSPSAMLSHLESGACSAGVNISAVNKVIMENDPTGIITDLDAKQKLEDWRKAQLRLMDSVKEEKEDFQAIPVGGGDKRSHEVLADLLEFEEETEGGVQIFTPNTFDSVSGGVSVCISGEMTPESYMDTPLQSDRGGIMTPASIIGGPNPTALAAELVLVENTMSEPRRSYVCSLCPRKKRSFRNKAALEKHLSSAAHAPKIFHCPTSLIDDYELVTGSSKKKNHFKMFTTLSGLAQHLEYEACKGGKDTFEKVIRFVEARMRDMGFEGKLLE